MAEICNNLIDVSERRSTKRKHGIREKIAKMMDQISSSNTDFIVKTSVETIFRKTNKQTKVFLPSLRPSFAKKFGTNPLFQGGSLPDPLVISKTVTPMKVKFLMC